MVRGEGREAVAAGERSREEMRRLCFQDDSSSYLPMTATGVRCSIEPCEHIVRHCASNELHGGR